MRHHLFGESLDGFVEESLRHPALVEHRELNVEVECFADPIRFVDDLIGAPAHRKGTDVFEGRHFRGEQVGPEVSLRIAGTRLCSFIR